MKEGHVMTGKKLFVSLVAVALLGSVSGSARAQFIWFDSVIEKIQARETIKVGVARFCGSVMRGADGGLIGFDIDIAEKIADEMEVEVEFVMVDFEDIIPDLIDEEFDVIISSLGMTTQRSLRVNFTAPADTFGLVIVVNKTLTQGVAKLEDLNSASVTFAAVSESTAEDFLNERLPKAKPLLLTSDANVLQALLNGTAHAAGLYEPSPTLWIEENPDTLQRLPGVDQQYNTIPGGFALRKGDVDALNFFNSWIAVNKANGWLKERSDYWFRTTGWTDRVAGTAGGSCDE